MTEEQTIPLTGTKVPVNFVYENEEGNEEEFSIELDSQVFYILCQEAMKRGVRVEEFILDSLMESMEEFDGERS
jgi:hypothetical protein